MSIRRLFHQIFACPYASHLSQLGFSGAERKGAVLSYGDRAPQSGRGEMAKKLLRVMCSAREQAKAGVMRMEEGGVHEV